MIRKESAFNQSNEEAAKRNKKDNIFKGKRVVETPKTTNQMDVDQAVEVLFQEDIVMDILSRLPVKSLLRFKCVSKLWRTLISDPYFKRKHLNRAMNDQDSRKFLISQVCGGRYPECYFYRSSFSSVRLYEDLQRLDYPYCQPWCHNIYSCCDGLFLIGALDYRDKHHRIFLWNPSMRESTVLPNPELPPRTQKTGCTWGLGYDSISDDYKILKISRELCSEIFALKSGSWRKIDNHPTAISPELSGMDSLAFVHGAFHWLGFSLNYSVVSFSISNEVYREISLPKRMCSMSNAERGVSVLRGMLCCYSSTSTVQGMGTFNIWLMRDYGVKESWSNVFIMENQGFCSAIPKYGFTDLDFLLRCRFKKRVGTKFTTSYGGIKFWPQRDSFTDVVVYTESLISPKLLT